MSHSHLPGELALRSAFQPLVSLSHRRIIGYEGLLRAWHGERALAPNLLFADLGDDAARLELDSAARRLHLEAYRSRVYGKGPSWLFLNLSPAWIGSGRFDDGSFQRALACAGVAAQSVVVEILEDAIADEGALVAAVDYFRELGCLVALDDFGTGHSNFARIWRLAPDIIKLDRSIIVQAAEGRERRQGRILHNLVNLVHEAGSLVVAEGVETEQQAMISLDADVDFVQGFYFGKPELEVTPAAATAAELNRVSDRFAAEATLAAAREQARLEPYVDSFRAAIAALAGGMPVQQACAQLLELPRVDRFYILNQHGEQVSNHLASHRRPRHDPRFEPIIRTSGGTWFRRHYYRRAVKDMRQLQVSPAYLSTTGTHMCRTLSLAMQYDGVLRVFCCDLYLGDLKPSLVHSRLEDEQVA